MNNMQTAVKSKGIQVKDSCTPNSKSPFIRIKYKLLYSIILQSYYNARYKTSL